MRHERGVGREPIRRDFRLLPEASSTPPCLLAMDRPSASALRLGPLSPLLLGLLLLAGSGCDSQPYNFHPLAVVITSPSEDTLVLASDIRVEGLVYGRPDHLASLYYQLNDGDELFIPSEPTSNARHFAFMATDLVEGINRIEVIARGTLDSNVPETKDSISITYAPDGGGGGLEYDLQLDVSSTEEWRVGEEAIFTVTVTKTPSHVPDPGIVVEMPVPEGLEFVRADPPDHLGTYDPATGRWRFTMTTVLTALQLIARADAEGSYTFHAEIVEGLGEGDNPSNNGVTWPFTVIP
jgi:hypothetical protein